MYGHVTWSFIVAIITWSFRAMYEMVDGQKSQCCSAVSGNAGLEAREQIAVF